jgi:hypothetical protein
MKKKKKKLGKNKFGSNDPNKWYSYSNYKPKKWRVVDGKEKIYTGMVEVYANTYDSIDQIDYISVDYQVIMGEDGFKVINMLKLNADLHERFDTHFIVDIDHFTRDTRLFPFIRRLKADKERYLRMKLKIERSKKFNILLEI